MQNGRTYSCFKYYDLLLVFWWTWSCLVCVWVRLVKTLRDWINGISWNCWTRCDLIPVFGDISKLIKNFHGSMWQTQPKFWLYCCLTRNIYKHVESFVKSWNRYLSLPGHFSIQRPGSTSFVTFRSCIVLVKRDECWWRPSVYGTHTLMNPCNFSRVLSKVLKPYLYSPDVITRVIISEIFLVLWFIRYSLGVSTVTLSLTDYSGSEQVCNSYRL